MLSKLSRFYSPSRRAIGHFSSTIAINSNAFRCSALYTSFGPVCCIIVAFPRTVMFLLLKLPSHTSASVTGSMLNDRLIPITTSYRVVVVVERSGGGLTRSSDNQRVSPGDIVNMEDYHDEATENPMYQTYTRVLHW